MNQNGNKTKTVSHRGAGYRKAARQHLRESAETKLRVADQCLDAMLAAADLIADTFRSGHKLLLCGNGGSAADCQHMATEFVSRLTQDFDRPGLPAIALTTDTSFLTAFANDSGYDGVFARQVQALGKPGDLLVAISTSGNSSNVVRAVEVAQEASIRTIAFTGRGGRLADMVDISIAVPSTNTNHIQEAHLAIEHALCHLVERILFAACVESARPQLRMVTPQELSNRVAEKVRFRARKLS